ncbi:hypothetical protein JG688_00005084 [Phytophthora aleatoria]|uniref:Transmembrane protein n=1 Tax=Phytophthora aleatoria TaxID=2496075 RepID=A0A8J5J044_9STRA|nr:hypothetical protein JG688_00005084 [Phytophthora aleatoria]
MYRYYEMLPLDEIDAQYERIVRLIPVDELQGSYNSVLQDEISSVSHAVNDIAAALSRLEDVRDAVSKLQQDNPQRSLSLLKTMDRTLELQHELGVRLQKVTQLTGVTSINKKRQRNEQVERIAHTQRDNEESESESNAPVAIHTEPNEDDTEDEDDSGAATNEEQSIRVKTEPMELQSEVAALESVKREGQQVTTQSLVPLIHDAGPAPALETVAQSQNRLDSDSVMMEAAEASRANEQIVSEVADRPRLNEFKRMAGQEFVDFSEGPPKLRPSTSQRALNSVDTIMQQPEGSPLARFIRLVHRLAVFAFAILYVEISLHSFSTAMIILHGSVSHDLPVQTHKASLILDYAGTSTIEASPLVQQVLKGTTSPRSTSLYLETATTQSSTGCSNARNFNAEIYSNEFLRFIFSSLQMHASHNLSYVTELELVAPVIDCTFDLLTFGDQTAARVYYLVRRKSNTTDVMLLSTSLSVQDYAVDKQFQRGPATLLLVAAIDDVRATTITHHIAVAFNYPYVAEPAFAYSELVGVDGDNYWQLQTLANPRTQDPAKFVRTARLFGRYLSDPTAQSNIEIAHWGLPSDPVAELGSWLWHSRAVLHDSWAWTHAVHGVFAINVIFNLSVLLFVMYRCIRKGHFWVGDAFSTISNMLLYRGLIVLLCNHLNGYWTVTKMCISVGDSITGLHAIYYRPELVHADLLAIFLNVASFLSYIARERVDPLFVFATFEIGWGYRAELTKLYPGLKKNIVNFAVADVTNGLLSVSPGLDGLSPMELMTAYEVVESRQRVVSSAVISIFSPLVLIAAYVVVRKAVRYVNTPVSSDKGTSRRRAGVYTEGSQQNDLTSFETATGAGLIKRFGVISGYENYIMREDRLTATIDAVYGNGFLVVKGKFLIGAQDLMPLLLMKLTRVRFTNIFVYEIKEKSSVEEAAQLVYPSTISWDDLWHLDVTTLT